MYARTTWIGRHVKNTGVSRIEAAAINILVTKLILEWMGLS